VDRRQASWYLVVQGCLGLLWWLLLYVSPTVRAWFVADAGWPVARSLVLADVLGFGVGSLIAGVAVAQGRQWAGGAVVAVTAVTAYATLVAMAWVVAPVDRVLPLVAMASALALTLTAARSVVWS